MRLSGTSCIPAQTYYFSQISVLIIKELNYKVVCLAFRFFLTATYLLPRVLSLVSVFLSDAFADDAQ